MKREEEIEKEARRVSCNGDEFHSFIQGAEFADSHPRKVYVIVRCEEHADYVEKVFADKSKAGSYCRQFVNNPNEYNRYATEMEVTL